MRWGEFSPAETKQYSPGEHDQALFAGFWCFTGRHYRLSVYAPSFSGASIVCTVCREASKSIVNHPPWPQPLRNHVLSFRFLLLYLRPVINRSVALYYSGQTALGLRCFRLALVLRHRLLRSNDEDIRETGAGEPASEADGCGARKDTIAAEAGEVAAAVTLNNFAVCLAGIGDTIAAAQALVISSTMTT